MQNTPITPKYLIWGNCMNNKGVPGLRKLYIFQFATNDENVKLGVYPGSDPENSLSQLIN